MNLKKTFLLAGTLAAVSGLRAQYISGEDQTSNKEPKKFRISSIYLSGGMLSFSTGGSPYDRMLSHSPHQSTLRALDAGYEWYSGNYFTANTWFAPYFALGLQPYNKEAGSYNPCREFMGGIGIIRGSETAVASKETKVGTDTLVRSHVDYQEQLRSIYARGSYIFRSDPARRISLHIGFGISSGASYSSSLVRSTFTDSVLNVKVGNTIQQFPLNNNYNNESRSYANSRAYSTQVFVPWGVSMRLAKTRPVASKIMLCFSMEAGMLFQNFERGESTVSDFANTSLGIKYNLSK